MDSKLEQLKKMTLVVADTGDLAAIQRYQPQDATTNPSLILKALALDAYQPLLAQARAQQGVPLYDAFAALVAVQIQQQVPGYVSVEVDARTSYSVEASRARAHQLIELIQRAGGDPKRILIKLAATWEGIQAAAALEQEGIACNLTLLFGQEQAKACADAGVTLISPFVGRILDWYQARYPEQDWSGERDPGVQSVRKIYQEYKAQGYATIIMGASFRNLSQIELLAGCDRLTLAPALLEALAQEHAPLATQLGAVPVEERRPVLSEALFRQQLADHQMAQEKLQEGIALFSADLEKVEAVLAQA